MQNSLEREKDVLEKLKRLEDLAEKKTRIFSRLLMDAALAQDMEKLALSHEERKQAVCLLLGEKSNKAQKEGAQKGEEE
jgi:hypothetical protein